MPREDFIQLRDGTFAEWSSYQEPVGDREPVWVSDRGVIVVGDGFRLFGPLYEEQHPQGGGTPGEFQGSLSILTAEDRVVLAAYDGAHGPVYRFQNGDGDAYLEFSLDGDGRVMLASDYDLVVPGAGGGGEDVNVRYRPAVAVEEGDERGDLLLDRDLVAYEVADVPPDDAASRTPYREDVYIWRPSQSSDQLVVRAYPFNEAGLGNFFDQDGGDWQSTTREAQLESGVTLVQTLLDDYRDIQDAWVKFRYGASVSVGYGQEFGGLLNFGLSSIVSLGFRTRLYGEGLPLFGITPDEEGNFYSVGPVLGLGWDADKSRHPFRRASLVKSPKQGTAWVSLPDADRVGEIRQGLVDEYAAYEPYGIFVEVYDEVLLFASRPGDSGVLSLSVNLYEFVNDGTPWRPGPLEIGGLLNQPPINDYVPKTPTEFPFNAGAIEWGPTAFSTIGPDAGESPTPGKASTIFSFGGNQFSNDPDYSNFAAPAQVAVSEVGGVPRLHLRCYLAEGGSWTDWFTVTPDGG